jgi:hypothetical protein
MPAIKGCPANPIISACPGNIMGDFLDMVDNAQPPT